jgi:hypothetical protein
MNAVTIANMFWPAALAWLALYGLFPLVSYLAISQAIRDRRRGKRQPRKSHHGAWPINRWVIGTLLCAGMLPASLYTELGTVRVQKLIGVSVAGTSMVLMHAHDIVCRTPAEARRPGELERANHALRQDGVYWRRHLDELPIALGLHDAIPCDRAPTIAAGPRSPLIVLGKLDAVALSLSIAEWAFCFGLFGGLLKLIVWPSTPAQSSPTHEKHVHDDGLVDRQ